MAQIDLRNATIRISDGGTNHIDVKIGEGTCDYNEKRQIEAVKNRGALDIVRENEDEPLEVSMNFVWEHITGYGGEITVEDALKRINGAAAWTSVVSGSEDPYAPYCVNIEIINNPPCTATGNNETITLEEFHYQELAHSLKDATVALRGMCNRTQASAVRS